MTCRAISAGLYLELVLFDGCGERDDRYVDARGSHAPQRFDATHDVAPQVGKKSKV